jgi:hypothetical protein
VNKPTCILPALLSITLLCACGGRPVPGLPGDTQDTAIPDPEDTDPVTDSGQDTDTQDPVDTSDSGEVDDTSDTQDTGEPPEPSSQDMVKSFFGPMMMTEGAHTYSHPDDLATLGFNTIDLSQYVLLGPDGVVSTQYSEQDITDRLNRFAGTGIQLSLTFVAGYTSTGDEANAVWGSQYTDEGADIETVLGHLSDHMVEMVPLAKDLGVYQLSVYEPDLLFYEKTNTDGSPNFDTVSAWSQTHLAAMQAAGWGDSEDEQLIWKFGYYYVPPTASGSNVTIDIDFSGYDGAGFSLSAEDASWESDATVWASIYRNQVDRFLEHFVDSLPDSTVWPAVTEFGAADASCGYWSSPDDPCEIYWTEEHMVAAYESVLDGVREWNTSHSVDYRGVFVFDPASDTGMFSIGGSETVRDAIQEGLAALE